MEGLAIGTAGYMSPEQVRGEPADARSDIFAVGGVLYEMLRGCPAFARSNAAEAMSATLREEPPDLESVGCPVPPALQRLIAHCLEKDPGCRFQSAQDLEYELRSLLAEPGPGLIRTRLLRAVRRPVWRVVALTGLILGTAGGGTLIWKAWHGAGTVPSGGVSSLVALPTKVFGSQESAFLTDAIPDTLSTLLGGVEGLDMKVPPTSVQVEKVQWDLGKIAVAYRVEYLLLSTVAVQGEHLILNVKLSEVATQKVCWAGQFEGNRAAYNTLVREAAVALAPVLRHTPSTFLEAGTKGNPAVEWAILQGRYYRTRYDATLGEMDFQQALAAFQRAQSLDPTSALAAAELAAMYRKRLTPGNRRMAEEWNARALELDSRCGLAWANRTALEYWGLRQDPDRVMGNSLKALAYAPQDPRIHLLVGQMGPTHALMVATSFHAMEMDPLNKEAYCYAALGLMGIGRAAEAMPILDRVLNLYPDDRLARSLKFQVLILVGRPEEAKRAYVPGYGSLLRMRLLAEGPARAREEALRMVADLRNREKDVVSGTWSSLALSAPILVRLGLREDALWLLQKPLDSGTTVNLDFLLRDPDLQHLRGDPRFDKILEGSRDYAMRFLKQVDQAEVRGGLPAYLKPALNDLRDLLKNPR